MVGFLHFRFEFDGVGLWSVFQILNSSEREMAFDLQRCRPIPGRFDRP